MRSRAVDLQRGRIHHRRIIGRHFRRPFSHLGLAEHDRCGRARNDRGVGIRMRAECGGVEDCRHNSTGFRPLARGLAIIAMLSQGHARRDDLESGANREPDGPLSSWPARSGSRKPRNLLALPVWFRHSATEQRHGGFRGAERPRHPAATLLVFRRVAGALRFAEAPEIAGSVTLLRTFPSARVTPSTRELDVENTGASAARGFPTQSPSRLLAAALQSQSW
jgi:hypothetical protein